MAYTYRLYEGNAGGKHFAVLNDSGECIYYLVDNDRDIVLNTLAALKAGGDPIADGWEGGEPDPAARFEEINDLVGLRNGSASELEDGKAGDTAEMDRIISARHGSGIFHLAADLGVSYKGILARYESKVGSVPSDDLFQAMFRLPPLSREVAADMAYNEIVSRCKAIYFGRISTEEAEIISNALIRVGHLYLAEELCFNSYEFKVEWEAVHDR